MKKIFLIFHGRFPSEKAAALFTAKNAEAFINEGYAVEIIVPARKGVRAQDAYVHFNMSTQIPITELSVPDVFSSPFKRIAFFVSFLFFSSKTAWYIKRHADRQDIIYSNETLPLFFTSFFSKNIFYEMHDFPESKLWLFGIMVRRMKWILIHNNWKIRQLKNTYKIPHETILYEPNAVDLHAFEVSFSKREAREKLDLPQDKKIAVYTGHLYGWKGVDTLAQAAAELPDDFLIVFVGGTNQDVAIFKKKWNHIKNIHIVGHRQHIEIPIWQRAADVLVLPNTGKEAISAYYTSPMKLFEYLASRKPIVASRIPSITEILNETNAILVEPDNPAALAQGIQAALNGSHDRESMVQAGYAYVQDHTWQKRAHRIVSFINHHA